MVLILLASTLISAFMGELTEAITIVSIVILNALMGFVQEYRTEKSAGGKGGKGRKNRGNTCGKSCAGRS